MVVEDGAWKNRKEALPLALLPRRESLAAHSQQRQHPRVPDPKIKQIIHFFGLGLKIEQKILRKVHINPVFQFRCQPRRLLNKRPYKWTKFAQK